MSEKLIFLVLFSLICDVANGGYFTIIGPETVSPGSKYRAVLASTAYDKPEILQVLIRVGSAVASSKNFTLSNSEQQDIFLNIPNNADGITFTLTAEYLSKSYRENSYGKQVKVMAKKYSVLIQTDKTIYKPGDKVQFRILVLDAEMKPYQYSKLYFAFTDGERKKVYGSETEMTEMGFFESSLQLSGEMTVGKWGLHVKIENDRQIAPYNFQVLNYQLPQFEVFIEPSARHVAYSDSVIVAQVYAKGKRDEFLNGSATVTATLYDPKNLKEALAASTKSVKNIAGKNDFSFSIANDLKMSGRATRIAKLQATFEDVLTEKTATAETFVVIHIVKGFKIDLKAEKINFTPGRPFAFQVRIRDFNGGVVDRKYVKVTLRKQFHKSCPSTNLSTAIIADFILPLERGVADYVVHAPKNAYRLIFDVVYENSVKQKIFERIPTKSQENIFLTINTKKLKKEKKFTIQVEGTHSMTEVHSVVFSRKGIVEAIKHNADDEDSFKIHYKLSPDMLPVSNFVVYYIHHSGEVVFAQLKVDFYLLVGNYLDLGVLEPGTKTSTAVKTAPGSFVGLLAVDQKASLLQNVINEEKVDCALSSLYFSNDFNEKTQNDLYSLLRKSNAFLITDADKGKPNCAASFSNYNDKTGDENTFKELENNDSDVELPQWFTQEAPETWFFKSFQVDSDGRYVLNETIPDTLTSYTLTGFSMHPIQGIGVAPSVNLGDFKNFFVELNIPRKVMIGDIVKVEVFVYTSVKSSSSSMQLKTKVTLNNDDEEFELFVPQSTGKSCSFVPVQTNFVYAETPPNSARLVAFYIKPKKSGLVKIKVKAETSNGRDETSKFISVEHPGLESSNNHVKFFDLRSKSFDSFYFNLQGDEKVYKTSSRLEISVVGDFMGLVVANLQDLLQKSPLKTTEPNLFQLMPTVVAMNYLKSVNKLSKAETEEWKRTLESGYQYIVGKKLSSGAFNIWPKLSSDEHIASTAFVVSFLNQVKDWIVIQDAHILDGLNFLMQSQAQNGQFVGGSASQKNTSDEVGLTAYVAIAFIENTNHAEKFSPVISNALNFLKNNFNDFQNDDYALAVSAYALAIGKNDAAAKFLVKLKENRRTEERSKISESAKNEIAAYEILAYENLNRYEEAFDMLNWLLSQKIHNERFLSTKDTAIAVQAFAAIAKHFRTDSLNMNVYFFQDEAHKEAVHMGQDDALKAVRVAMQTTDGISFQANGTGIAYVQVWQKVFLKPDGQVDKFKVEIRNQPNFEELEICVSFIADEFSEKSKVAVAEVSLPSGFEFDDRTVGAIVAQGVKKVNTKQSKTVVSLFFASVEVEQTCVKFGAIRRFFVSSSAQFAVKVYEFGDKDRFSVEYYSAQLPPVCDA